MSNGSTLAPDEPTVFQDTLKALLRNEAKIHTDLRGAEDSTRQVYSDRFLFELLQNARDAAAGAERSRARASFRLGRDALAVANDGASFDRGGYEAITGIGKSGKSALDLAGGPRLIGRKGIGFKSVLRVSRSPQIFGRAADGSRFAIEFGSPRIPALCAAAADADEQALRALLRPEERPWFEGVMEGMALEQTSLARSIGDRGVDRDMLLDRLPIMLFPLWVRDVPPSVERLLTEEGYDTVIRLPLAAEGLADVRTRLREDIEPEKLLFLGVLERVEVIDESANEPRSWAVDADWAREQDKVTLHVQEPEDTERQTRKYRLFEDQLRVDLPDGGSEPRQIRIAVPMRDKRVRAVEPRPLFNYYPLVDEGTPLPLLLHAEFEVDPGRTKFSPDHPALNGQLIEGLAELLAGGGRPGDGSLLGSCASGKLDAAAQLPMMLLPEPSERSLPRALHESMLERLRALPCVPCTDGLLRRPNEVRAGPLARKAAEVFGEAAGRHGAAIVAAETQASPRFGRTEEALGIPRFGSEDLLALLDAGVAAGWTDPARFGALYDLIREAAELESLPPEDLLDRYRPGGDGPPIGLLPCPTASAGLRVEPLTRRRQSGGQTREEQALSRKEVRVYHRSGTDALDGPPPDALRLRFLHPAAMGEHAATGRHHFIEESLDVKSYETEEVLRRLDDVDYDALAPDDCRSIARFILGMLARPRLSRWSVLARVETGHSLRPERFFAGFPRDEDEEANAAPAREALSLLRLPAADGSMLPARQLRFGPAWGPQYEALHALAPRSAAPLAAPDELVAYLDAEDLARNLDGDRAEPLQAAKEDGRIPQGGSDPGARVLAHALARMAGVWETLPLGYVPVSERRPPDDPWTLDRFAEIVPGGKRLAATIRGGVANSFGRINSYRHRNTRIEATWWVLEPESLCRDAASSRALLEVLASSWNDFFQPLGRSMLYCRGCRVGNASHRVTQRTGRDSQAPSALFTWLRDAAWYAEPEPSGTGLVSPRRLWLVSDPPSRAGLHNSPMRFLPHVREQEPELRHVLVSLHLPSLTSATATHCLDQLDELRARHADDSVLRGALKTSQGAASFRGLHQLLYGALQDISTDLLGNRRAEVRREMLDAGKRFSPRLSKADWRRLKGLPLLAERDRELVFLPAEELLVDDGRDSYARHLFDKDAAFAVVDERSQVLARMLGASRFEVQAQPELEGDADVTDEAQRLLEPMLPSLVAAMTRIVPGGGRPVELGSETLSSRVDALRKLRFVHCKDLRIVYGITDRPDLGRHSVGAERAGDAYLDDRSLVFDHALDPDLDSVLPQLARELSRVLAGPEYMDLFHILLDKRNEEERLRYLEPRGVTRDDIRDAEEYLGVHHAQRWQRFQAIWRALCRCAPLRELECSRLSEAKPTSASEAPLDRWSVFLDTLDGKSSLCADIASIVPELVDPEALHDGALGGPLDRLERAGVPLEALSAKLESEDLGRIRIDTHRIRLRLLRQRHRAALIAVQRLAGRSAKEAERALEEAAHSPAALSTRVRVEDDDLLAPVSALLAGCAAGLRPPSPEEHREAYLRVAADAMGCSPASLVELAEEYTTPEERRSRRYAQFSALRDRFRPFLLALAIEPHDLRTARVLHLNGRLGDEAAFPEQGPLTAPFSNWLVTRGKLARSTAERVVQAWETAGRDAASIVGRELHREDLPQTLEVVRRILDKGRRKRARRVQQAFQSHRDIELDALVGATPATRAADESAEAATEQRSPSTEPAQADEAAESSAKKGLPIRRGAVKEDAQERERRGRLGEQGEDVAFAWAASPLVRLYTEDAPRFRQLIRRIHARLVEWQLDASLRGQFDAALASLSLQDLDRDELLELLADLLHVSGDHGSDAFGFDVIAWLPELDRVLVVEVKTGRRPEDPFHFSRRQYAIATEEGERYGLLRVAIPPRGSAPTLRLYIDPVELATRDGALRLTPDGWLGTLRPGDGGA